ncbi:MAG TPA: flagellar hook-associated protein FlgK [Stellaceae bacterium]|nr:flagellar hook-associated protein FlgK [Stellaceae bacterium]
MNLAGALSNAMSGLQAAQSNIQLISSNISNAQTPGYSLETVTMTPKLLNGAGSGVQLGLAQRQINQTLATNARNQDTAANGASVANTYFQEIQNLFGQVNDGSSLSDTYGNFTSALQTLSTTPDDQISQQNVVATAGNLASQLNSLSSGIQTIRASADGDISNDVSAVNTALQQIANYNQQITHERAAGEPTAALEDQRDQALDQISKLMGVNALVRSNDTMVVFTSTGQVLVDGTSAQQLSYTQSGAVTAQTPLSKVTLNGTDITGDITTGAIGNLLNLRDTQLPNLTAELNQFSVNLYNSAQVTSSTQLVTVGGTPPAAGDTFSVSINGGAAVTTAALPANPTISDVVNAINTAIGAGTVTASVNGNNIVFTDTAGSNLNVSVTATVGGETFTGSTPNLPFHLFSGVNPAGPAPQDNAATIAVNPTVAATPSLLDGTSGNPDPSISQTLSNAITAVQSFAAAGNLGTATNTTLSDYSSQIIGQVASATSSASDNSTFQSTLQQQLAARAADVSGVNIDQEMAQLTVFQNMYQASAQVLSAVQSMLDTLIKM